MTSLLFQDVQAGGYRLPEDNHGLTEGNFLLYAIACRWVAELTYVQLDEATEEDEEFPFIFRDFAPRGDKIQLVSMTPPVFQQWSYSLNQNAAQIAGVEPEVPYERRLWREFEASRPYDFVCLTRSPLYAPATTDPLYDAIAATFIDPVAL